MNWNKDNTITKANAQECYTIESLQALFLGLHQDGYSALGLGLIIDLVRRDANRVGLPIERTALDSEEVAK